MKNGKDVTIYDLARQLNISAATVSRGLQNHPGISKKTKKRISELADQIGYRTNPFARNLRNQQTKTIGVLVHELNSHFVTSVLAGIDRITSPEGYDIIIAHSSESSKKEAANAKNLFNKRVDGLIVSLSGDTTSLDHFDPFFEKGVPVIFFDRVEQDGKRSVVVIDNMKSGYMATHHLIEQGCKRIVHCTLTQTRNVYAERVKGYKDALRDHGLPFEEDMLIVEEISRKAGVSAAMKILAMDPLPDGAFITNDFMAAVCIKTLKEHGVSIPRDIAIVGFNNDAITQLIEPTLTTINYPGEIMGEIVARNLVNHLSGVGNVSETNTIIVRSELIVRESSIRNPPPSALS
jgi:LacI family transcriptional regulator